MLPIRTPRHFHRDTRASCRSGRATRGAVPEPARNEKSKVTSITATHEMDSAFRIATRMAMLYQGKIIEEAEPQEFKRSKNPVVAQFVSGSTEGPILEGSLDAITKK